DGEAHSSTVHGVRLFAPAKKEKLSWIGAHTALLLPASATSAEAPAGSGFATASIDKKGRLKFAGRLADDARFTAAPPPDEAAAVRHVVGPNRERMRPLLAVEIALQSHRDTARSPGRRYLPAGSLSGLLWTKAALPEPTPASKRDKSYREGIHAL